MGMIYLDNAASSGKKPDAVYEAVARALRECSGNPGRSGHAASLAAGKVVSDTRIRCARLFGVRDASRICFTSNATMALNMAIFGVVRPGAHIITSSLEHNSVSRPLEQLRSLGTELTVLPASLDTGVDPDDVRAALRPDTALIVMTHVSNVTGTVNDILSIGRIATESGIPFLVDAAQSAGSRDIDVNRDHIDLLAFPGHKGLFGPQGTGGLYVREGISLRPLIMGGTGSFSEQPEQPERMPDRLESGTLNVPGLAGLGEGIRFLLEGKSGGKDRSIKEDGINERSIKEDSIKEESIIERSIKKEGISKVSIKEESNKERSSEKGSIKNTEIREDNTMVRQIWEKEALFRARLYEGLSEIPGIRIYAPGPGHDAGCVLSFTLEGMESAEMAAELDAGFGIAVRAGLHCAPYAHKLLGTLGSGGTVRVSPDYFNEMSEIEAFLDAVRLIRDDNV